MTDTTYDPFDAPFSDVNPGQIAAIDLNRRPLAQIHSRLIKATQRSAADRLFTTWL